MSGDKVELEVTCAACKKVERATPEEKKTQFFKSVSIAGWRRRGEDWKCPDCAEHR